MIYMVYRNLTNGLWSIKCKATNLVVGHADYIEMFDCEYVVNQSGRERVLKERKKYVHAYVVGKITEVEGFKPFKGRTLELSSEVLRDFWQVEDILYNPYLWSQFVVRGQYPVYTSDYAQLTVNRQVRGGFYVN